jgi:hypothetical protein
MTDRQHTTSRNSNNASSHGLGNRLKPRASQKLVKGRPAVTKTVRFPQDGEVRKLRRERMRREMQNAARMAVEGSLSLHEARRWFETIMVELVLDISDGSMKVAGVLLELDSEILPLAIRQAHQWRKQAEK